MTFKYSNNFILLTKFWIPLTLLEINVISLFIVTTDYSDTKIITFKKGTSFEACVLLFFIKFLFFTKWWPFKNYEKCFLFHLKSSFHSRDIQFFVFLSFPLFLPVGHCFRGWLKINLKVYDVISCLNKNLITHFVWCLEKEIRCDIETLSIDRVLNKEHFCRKSMQKMCTKS